MHSIAMPKDGEQHELMLEFKANGDSYVTRMNDIYITDYATIYTDFLVTNRVTYALSVCLLFIGFVLLLLGMVMMLTRTWFTHLISLGIFSLMVGLWTMGKYNILQIYRVCQHVYRSAVSAAFFQGLSEKSRQQMDNVDVLHNFLGR